MAKDINFALNSILGYFSGLLLLLSTFIGNYLLYVGFFSFLSFVEYLPSKSLWSTVSYGDHLAELAKNF